MSMCGHDTITDALELYAFVSCLSGCWEPPHESFVRTACVFLH